MSTAMFPFSADPITYGHIDIIEQASNMFDKVYVVVTDNPNKKYLIRDRLSLTKESLQYISNVEVISSVSVVDTSLILSVDYLVRGIRNSNDFEYEDNLIKMYKALGATFREVFIRTRSDLEMVSSSFVKEAQRLFHDITSFVPMNVKRVLERKVSNVELVGVIGGMGSGKSYFCRQMVEKSISLGFTLIHLDVDKLGHRIYESSNQLHVKTCCDIINRFENEISLINEDGRIDRKKLSSYVFSDTSGTRLSVLNQLVRNSLLFEIRKELRNISRKAKCLTYVLFDAALLIELELSHICNNRVIVLNTVSESERLQRVMDRDSLSKGDAKRKMSFQYSVDDKKKSLMSKIINEDGFGQLWELINTDPFEFFKDNVLLSSSKI